MGKLTQNQLKIVKKAIKWYYIESYEKIYFSIGGIAGSGKSFLVKHLVKLLNLENYEVLFVAYSGKAALRLRISGNNANTIHSTFYKPYELPSGEVRFSKKSKIESNIKLIILDEAGMVGEKMVYDILSFGIPTILLGDPKQLDPIMSKPNPLMKIENLDGYLDEPMRFSDLSGILELSILARNNKPINYGIYKESQVTHFTKIRNMISNFDVVLCYKNSTRKWLNKEIRKQLNYDKSIYPMKGEKIICLKNNYNHEIIYNDIQIYLINGLIGVMIEDSTIDKETGLLNCKFIPDFINPNTECEIFDVFCHPEYFSQHYYPEIELPPLFYPKSQKYEMGNDEKIAFLTFGYSCSIYKYQGSEANNILAIIDDYNPNRKNHYKIIYTMITRAKNSIILTTFK